MKTFFTIFATLALFVLSGCENGLFGCDDCCDDCLQPPPLPPREDLTQRWHVLNNIEYSYRMRRADIYDELLNADFVFYFSPGDVDGGSPESWSRAEELDATTRLFLSNQQTQVPPSDPVCRSMRVDLVFDKDDLYWIEFIPEAFPSEKWYTTTVFYTFTFEIEPNTTYIAQNGAKAEFTVRNAGTDQAHWELVEFRDLGSTVARSTSAVAEASTWGKIKALYP